MSKFAPHTSPEVFVSNAAIRRQVARAVEQGRLRRLASRLYTPNLTDDPVTIIRRNVWPLVAAYFPGALIADRTALENMPAADGSVCLIADGTRNITLPGLVLRPRPGSGPRVEDPPFIDGLYLCSTARAYLENMRPSRSRGGLLARTLGRRAIEERLETLISRGGEDEINRLRDRIKYLAPILGLSREGADLDAMIGAMLGTRDAVLETPAGVARQAGQPDDRRRVETFQRLHAALRAWPPTTRLAPSRSTNQKAVFAFYEAYFSNFIEGTEFEVQEAAEIVFQGRIPQTRPADAHDILGTFRVAIDNVESRRTRETAGDFIKQLRDFHAIVMAGHPDIVPGQFKSQSNRAGTSVFVAPSEVEGMLVQGFALLRSLETPFQRAAFMMFLVAEVHPFADGNGRTARLMMNAVLSASGEERIIIPTVYRGNYLVALKALTQTDIPDPLLRVLDYAWRWTAAIDWQDVEGTRRELEACNAFVDSQEADEAGIRLRMPGKY
jgi:fido (protein-threonine AMPylation protein)